MDPGVGPFIPRKWRLRRRGITTPRRGSWGPKAVFAPPPSRRLEMNKSRHSIRVARAAFAAVVGIAVLVTAAHPATAGTKRPTVVEVKLSEWSIGLSPARVPAGPVSFHITNGGSIPHAFEVEGRGIEREIAPIPRGGSGSLALALEPATYEVYCPIGNGSHKMLGMRASLVVAGRAGKAAPVAMADDDDHDMHEMNEMHEAEGAAPLPHAM